MKDKIKNILAGGMQDYTKINALAVALERLFIDELTDIINLATQRLDDDNADTTL